MEETQATEGPTSGAPPGVRTFLIADLRGYTRFTDEHGDEAAAQLTMGFLALAREAVSSRSGEVVEVRGDEVLAVFDSPREAIRAALDLVTAVEAGSSPELPMLVGIGLDAGEAVPVDGGYRGMALNMAARLCAKARPGEILVTPELAHLAGSVPGLAFEEREAVRLKGLSRPIRLHAVVTYGATTRTEGADAHHGSIGFNVLGPLEVLDGGRPIPLGGPKQRLVLALLILQADRVVPIERLIDDLWGDDPPAAARNTIQSYVSHLRNALGAERIESKAPGYVLHAEPDEVDVLRFERLLRRARRHAGIDPAKAVATFDEALTLWRGPPLADLADQPSLAAVASRLEDLRLGATEDLIGARLALGEHATVIADLEALIASHPLRERSWGALMLAQYRAGRQGEALETFGRARTLLADELGIDPSSELRELHERMLKQDPSLELKGRALRSYRLLEQIGEGAFGVVWRAIDPGVGREVAVKQIQPRLADDPAFVRRFEQEAQSVARIEHPYVVPLYDYWRDGGGAYLVMRLMRGGSLAGSLERGPLSLDAAADVIDHVAAALSAAHRLRLVHRDVRPENVLLDEEGNAYLSDFGLADDQTSGVAASSGSSGYGYRSPEQIRGEGATPRSDIYALGMLLHALLAGREVPPEVDEVIARATAEDPADRYADAGDLADRFRSALHASVPEVVATKTSEQARNPYKGLRPFSEADAGDFFGRAALIDRLVARLAETGSDARFLAVVGPSGSGKSSAVRAGLLPALRAGVVSGSDRWFYAEMLPGSRPTEELEAALLRVAADPPASLLEILDRDQHGLTRAIDRVLPEPNAELLLVVDQFEEIFTLVAREEDRVRFLECLVAAVTEPGSRIRIVATLRADFYDRPLAYPGLADLIRARTETVVPLSSEELERAIVGPAEAVGATAELSLVAEVVGDVTDQPGALPLMQYALTETFERRREGVLTLEAYREAGGVTGAIARRAEELLTAMNQAGREATRQLFLRLVTIGEGSEDTRRLVSRAELGSLEVDPDAMGAVIEVFGRHRLLSFDRDPDTRGPTVEVAHEALLREWGRLRGWIDAAREDVIMHRRLAAEAEEWERSSRDPSFLLRGSRLTQFEGWFEGSALALSGDERRYIEESVRSREVERAEEEHRATRERGLERRSRTRLRALVAVLTVAALVASLLTVAAVGQRSIAQQQERVATARELAAAATANFNVDPQRSILLALAAVHASQPVLLEAVQALHGAVAADREILTLKDPSTANVAWSPDGRLLATGGSAGGNDQTDALLWDARTGALVHRLVGHTSDINYLAFSPDSTRLVTVAGQGDDRTIVWDTRTGKQVQIIRGAGGILLGARFSPDGIRLAISEYLADANGNPRSTIHVVDVSTGTEEWRTPSFSGFTSEPVFSPDGTRVAAIGGSGTLLFDTSTGRRVLKINTNLGPSFSDLAFSPDGNELVTAAPNEGDVWDVRPGRRAVTDPKFRLLGQRGLVGVDWSSDGRLLATGGNDGTARIWDATTGEQMLVLTGHSGGVALVAFSPDGTRLLTGGGDGTARVWDITRTATAEVFGSVESSPLSSVAYTPDGSSLLTTEWDQRAWLRNSTTFEKVRGFDGGWGDAAFGPGGSAVAIVGYPPYIAETSSGKVIETMPNPAHGDYGNKVTFSSDGNLIATAQRSGTVALYDVSTGSLLMNLGESPSALDSMSDVAFSPDGKLLAGISGFATLHLWKVPSGAEVFHLQAQSGEGTAVAFAPDGKELATGGLDGATVWSIAGKKLATMTGGGRAESVAVSPDGKTLATGGGDDIARIWDVATGQLVVELGGHSDIIDGVAFSPDGTELATVSVDGTLRVYTLSTAELVNIARSRLTRDLTTQECQQYLHVDTCPPSPALSHPGPSAPASPGPDGAYRVTIAPSDVPVPPLHPSDAQGRSGIYSWSLVDGAWRFLQELADGSMNEWGGSYRVNGDRIEFTTLQGDPACLGWTFSARWQLAPGSSSLSFTDTSAQANPSCGPQAPNDAWVATLLASHPWQRVT